mmetsp:Transcript_57584/g.106412  ORF Transcript_57584/g.106412 Transcript_57584/m.106412 type:complete len:214 (-) Transcript_57584:1319-1960(-)
MAPILQHSQQPHLARPGAHLQSQHHLPSLTSTSLRVAVSLCVEGVPCDSPSPDLGQAWPGVRSVAWLTQFASIVGHVAPRRAHKSVKLHPHCFPRNHCTAQARAQAPLRSPLQLQPWQRARPPRPACKPLKIVPTSGQTTIGLRGTRQIEVRPRGTGSEAHCDDRHHAPSCACHHHLLPGSPHQRGPSPKVCGHSASTKKSMFQQQHGAVHQG